MHTNHCRVAERVNLSLAPQVYFMLSMFYAERGGPSVQKDKQKVICIWASWRSTVLWMPPFLVHADVNEGSNWKYLADYLSASSPFLSPNASQIHTSRLFHTFTHKEDACWLLFLAFFLWWLGQLLSYLIVIDFESTCWENKKGFQEISKLIWIWMHATIILTGVARHTTMQLYH